ncbi:FAD-dependent monooxygenase [Herbiconiux sp. A18JL235]|uniref:FAD-dependent monooxygenase n=1 Tax=Herbiconiux sp. A18JL235 TaxID=3152363 RepID=A0AB39BMB6_9MICO
MVEPEEASVRPSAASQVLIVGAGPVGLVLAIELARRGVAFRIVDRLAAPTTESRAVVVHARSLEMMDALGGSLVDELRATGVVTTGVQFHGAERTVARFSFEGVDSPHPYSITTPQTETERILTRRLNELGVTIERGVQLTDLTQTESGVRVQLAGELGTETLEVGWVVGCDGARSAVRHHVGERLVGSFHGERFLMGDVEADAERELDRSSMQMYLGAADGPGVVFPMAGTRARVIVEIDSAGEAPPATLDWLQRVVDERRMGLRLRDPHWLTTFDIHHAQVPRYRVGRVLLAGDAAHVHSPAGGQGMNTGMQDAFNLGWKLALVADGALAPADAEWLLDSYEAERHPVAARVIRFSTGMTKVGTLDTRPGRFVRDHLLAAMSGLAPARARLAAEIEEIGVDYRGGPLGATDGASHRAHVRAGDALPVSLRTTDAAAGAPLGATRVDVAAEHPAARSLGLASHGGTVLLRPDGYIAGAFRPADAPELATHAARLGA